MTQLTDTNGMIKSDAALCYDEKYVRHEHNVMNFAVKLFNKTTY